MKEFFKHYIEYNKSALVVKLSILLVVIGLFYVFNWSEYNMITFASAYIVSDPFWYYIIRYKK